jgi:predicted ferric reductase
MTNLSNELESTNPVASLQTILLGAVAILVGTLLSAVLLPKWLPGLTTSVLGESPKMFWYLSRGSAMVGFGLLWMSMALGLIITNRIARLWPGGPVAFDLHQYVSLLGLGFGLFHGLILLGDHYINTNLLQVLVPFTNQTYKPVFVGLGQVAFYSWVLLVGSFYIRKQLSGKTWRLIHFVSFLTFTLVMMHGILSGTDSHSLWAGVMYWFAGGSLLLLLFYRIMVTVGVKKGQRAVA